MEKIFFNWILKNPEHFRHVQGYFFENEDIKFIYNCIRNEFMSSTDKMVPAKAEIMNLVMLMDKTARIGIDFIKALLKINFEDYRDEFVVPRFNAWVYYHSAISGLMDSYEDIKGIDKTDIGQVEEAIAKIRKNIDTTINIQLTKGNLGLDFDDVESHDQDAEHNKIPSGFKCFDSITDGGFDRKTFNVFMGAPGSGKSLTLQNLAVNFVDRGYNVAYISLELSEKKCMKRIGSMRLEIPIADYNEISKDKEYMREKIRAVNSKNSDEFFNTKPGKLFVKEYPSGSATISDIDKYLQQVREEAGIDIDCLLVDYIQIMGTEKGVDRNMLYLKGEHLAVGLRAIAQRRNLVSITATQTDKNKYGVNSLSLGDIPESKAIADTADSVWAIILTPLMKMEGSYHWQHLKLRDCSTDIERIGFKFNKLFLKLHDDYFIQSTLG